MILKIVIFVCISNFYRSLLRAGTGYSEIVFYVYFIVIPKYFVSFDKSRTLNQCRGSGAAFWTGAEAEQN